MIGPSIENLRECFSLIEDPSQFELMIGFQWSEDPVEQERAVRHLIRAASSGHYPAHLRMFAYDKLSEIAKECRRNPRRNGISFALVWWALGVAAGEIERPKKRPGRTSNTGRDLLIGATFKWLVDHLGKTEPVAIEFIRKAEPRSRTPLWSAARRSDAAGHLHAERDFSVESVAARLCLASEKLPFQSLLRG